jgi:phage regulator Rha-like protein
MKKNQLTKIDNILEVNQGKPMVSSLKVSELLKRPHDQVLRAIRKVGASQKGLDVLVETYLDKQGKEQPVYWLGERSSLIVMPYIGGDKSMEGQTKLVDAYLHYRDNFQNPPRKDLMKAKRAEALPMMDMKKFVCQMTGLPFVGKTEGVKEHNFCNRALTGAYSGLDESTLDNYDLRLLAAIRRYNTVLIPFYPKQKEKAPDGKSRYELMEEFVMDYRFKNPRTALIST